MGFFQRIGQLFSRSAKPEKVSDKKLIQDLVDKARRAQYSENYDEALALLSQAMEVTEQKKDIRIKVDIALSRGDILIARKDYDTAYFVLNELREDSEARHLYAPLAYSLCSLGILEQVQGNLAKAQELFETAREKADSIRTDGASGRAIAHLGDLSLLEGNASYAVYLLEDAIEKLNRSGDRELLGYFLGQLGLAQIQNGQAKQGEIRLQRGLDLAMNVQHQPQMRYLNNLLGQQAAKSGNFQQAQNYFQETLKLYPDPPSQTAEYIILLCDISQTHLHIHQIEEAKQYAERALSIAESLSDGNLLAMAKGTIGLVMRADKDDSALLYLRESVNGYDDEVNSFYIRILSNLAGAQIESGDITGGIASYENAIEKAIDLPEEAGQVHNELAYHYAKNREQRKAIEQWQNAISSFEQANQREDIICILCDIASMYERLGDGRMAQRDYGKALEMLSQIDDKQIRGSILANIARAYSNYGDVETAEDFFKESISIAQNHQNKDVLAVRRGNYGRLLALTNRPTKAFSELKQAQEDSEKVQSTINLAYIGLAHAMSNDYEEASEHYQDALSAFTEIGATEWQAKIHAHWGDNAMNSGNMMQAEKHYRTAYHLAQENEQVDVLIQAKIGLAKLAIQSNDLETAKRKLSEIDPVANRLNYRRILANLHQAWSQYHAKQGNSDKATSEWEEAEKIRRLMQMSPIEADWL